MKPVLIIGAGPVGMTLASELARYGVPVRIVDKAGQRTDKSKALVDMEQDPRAAGPGRRIGPVHRRRVKVVAVNFIAGDKAIGRVTHGKRAEPVSLRANAPAVRDRASARGKTARSGS